MKKRDVVYILKNKWIEAGELKHSLRTVEAHFPHRKVLFYGGRPEGIIPDGGLEFKQEGETRYERVKNSIAIACQDPTVSDEFWLFNDDFFILHDVKEDFCYDRGEIRIHVRNLYQRHGFVSAYSNLLKRTAAILESEGYPTLDYTLHLPMLINKKAALDIINDHPSDVSFRTLYGNCMTLDSETIDDVKITSIDRMPSNDWQFLSTNDGAFLSGRVGSWLCQRYNKPSRWEVG